MLRGEIGAGEPVEVIGPGVHFLITCAALWIPGRGHADRVTAGRTVGLTLGETTAGQLRAGQLIAVPRTVTVQARFRGWAHILEDDDPGTRVRCGDRIGVHLYSAEIAGEVTGVLKRPPFDLPAPGAPGAAGQARAGETVLVTITLAQPAAMAAGTRFGIQSGGHAVAVGTVTA